MAITKVVKIVADASDATKELKNIKKGVEDVGNAANETSKEVADVGKSAKESKKGFEIMGVSIKSVGTALKAAGIGLVISLIAGLTEAFSRNKKVMDSVEIVLETIGQVFSQIATALIDTYEAVAKSSENFDALGKVISGLITIGLAPLKVAFYGIVQAAEVVKLAYEQMFGDETSIAKAQANLDETNQKLKDIASETVQAGKDVFNNFSEAIGEVSNISTIASEEFSKVSIKNAKAQADNYKAAKDAAILAQAQSSALRASYELEAAELKKIRDNVNLSLQDRIKANNDLAENSILVEEQMKRQAQLVVNLAALEVQRNNSIENQAALIQANADLKAVEADIAGKTEEIETNRVGLLNEQNSLLQTQIDADLERQRIQREFKAEQETDPLKKLQLQKESLDLENQAILDDLERKREIYAEGTQARIDAEEDFLNKKQAIDNKITVNANKTAEIQSKNDVKFADLTASAKLGIASDVLAGVADLVDKNSVAGKGIAVAQTGINTAQGIMQAFATLPTIPAFAAAAVVGLTGVLKTKDILTTKVPSATGKGYVSGGGGGGATPTAPAFNLVEGTADNQINESINLGNQEPVQAYVVSGDVTTAQSLDNNIITESGL